MSLYDEDTAGPRVPYTTPSDTTPAGPSGRPLAAPDGWTAAQPPTPEPEASRRFGRIGAVPWTFTQTLLGSAITLIPWVLIIVVAGNGGSSAATPTHPVPRLQDALAGIFFVIFTAIVEGAFLLAPAFYAVVRRRPGVSVREGLRALGLRRTPLVPAVGWVIGGLAVVLMASVFYEAIITTFHLNLHTNATTLELEARYAPLTVIGALIGAVFIAPFCEEIFFRGFMFAGLLRGMAVWIAVLLSALLFGIAHGDVGSFALLVVIGIVLAIVRWRTGSVWPGMALHAANNAIAAVVVIGAIIR
jgi:membrane protease YdiL (CAAX protease family)